jgi:two-component system sensor histidine kinase KdpD
VKTLTRVAASAAALALVTGAIELLKGHVPVLSLAVLYLLAIIPVAVAWGTVYAVGTAIGSTLAFKFFFVEPLYTFTISDSKNWLKTALLRSVSHDLRSPLTAILASADALASSGLMLEPEDRLALAETIRAEATRLDRVVEQLLDLSRLEAGAAEPHRELWHVDELVGQALAGLGAETGRIRLDIGSETPPVEVDAAQVERVLANLLENALRYSPAGSQVLLRVERGATELRIHVVDSGAGLPDEQREALFQPFHRGAAGHGSGLGLAIARGFAEANGGRLWAQDDPGGGHLVLTLPLAERRAAVPA